MVSVERIILPMKILHKQDKGMYIFYMTCSFLFNLIFKWSHFPSLFIAVTWPPASKTCIWFLFYMEQSDRGWWCNRCRPDRKEIPSSLRTPHLSQLVRTKGKYVFWHRQCNCNYTSKPKHYSHVSNYGYSHFVHFNILLRRFCCCEQKLPDKLQCLLTRWQRSFIASSFSGLLTSMFSDCDVISPFQLCVLSVRFNSTRDLVTPEITLKTVETGANRLSSKSLYNIYTRVTCIYTTSKECMKWHRWHLQKYFPVPCSISFVWLSRRSKAYTFPGYMFTSQKWQRMTHHFMPGVV